jgi:hypothetical protein
MKGLASINEPVQGGMLLSKPAFYGQSAISCENPDWGDWSIRAESFRVLAACPGALTTRLWFRSLDWRGQAGRVNLDGGGFVHI